MVNNIFFIFYNIGGAMCINTKIFDGKHCETTAIGAVLAGSNIFLSEEMLFGIGEGLGYICMKFGGLDFPFIGGRRKTGTLLITLCENLNLNLEIKRTTSLKKAWNNLKSELDMKKIVGLQLDSYYLDYFTSKNHFAGHFIAVTGFDTEYAYVVDTFQQGKFQKTTLENLALARSSKQPMSDKNMSFTITGNIENIDMKSVLIKSIKANAKEFLNPPISNFGYKGIIKTSKELKKYYKLSNDISKDFSLTSIMIEKAGTGGGLFRKIYASFLSQANELLQCNNISKAQTLFEQSAILWSKIADLFEMISNTKTPDLLDEISDKLSQIAKYEFDAMNLLNDI